MQNWHNRLLPNILKLFYLLLCCLIQCMCVLLSFQFDQEWFSDFDSFFFNSLKKIMGGKVRWCACILFACSLDKAAISLSFSVIFLRVQIFHKPGSQRLTYWNYNNMFISWLKGEGGGRLILLKKYPMAGIYLVKSIQFTSQEEEILPCSLSPWDPFLNLPEGQFTGKSIL